MSPKATLMAARTGLALIAVAAMAPLSYWGFLIGGGLGADLLADRLGSAYSLLGMVLGSIIVGGGSLAIPASLAIWVDRALEKRLLSTAND